MRKNPIICVDFDGVIHSYTSGWQGIANIPDLPVKGAFVWLMHNLPNVGCLRHVPHIGPIVQIYSARSRSWKGRRAMRKWFLRYHFPKAKLKVLKFPSKKPAAFLTIDDRAICFKGTFPTMGEMMSFKPWYKRSKK